MESLKSQVQYLLDKEKIQESENIEVKRGQFNTRTLKRRTIKVKPRCIINVTF